MIATRFAMLLSVCFVLALCVCPAGAEDEYVTLSGEIEAAEYDDDGGVTSVLVYDVEWGEVLMLNEGKGAELLAHVGEDVSVTGKLVELGDDAEYTYGLKVTAYTFEVPDEPDDYEEPGSDG
jgi:hypothetical protein